ncbi:hypothetical protein [Pseudomonas sp. TWI628]|uniref:hypothetical protein n=1 Tax=Pseudomonas sp. TWI628 TaxID=3136788 RepID=UPI00320A8062
MLRLIVTNYKDSTEVLDEAERLTREIESHYHAARFAEGELSVKRVQVKAAIECIRSALEYTAQDIWRSYTKKQNSVYFPYGEDLSSFQKGVKKNLPDVDVQAPELYRLIESLQPHACGDNWVYQLCKASNYNKHNGLSEQVRKNSQSNRLEIGNVFSFVDCEGITLKNCSIDGVPIGKSAVVKISNSDTMEDLMKQITPGITLAREFQWVEFHLEACDRDLLELLKRGQESARLFVEKVNSALSGQGNEKV